MLLREILHKPVPTLFSNAHAYIKLVNNVRQYDFYDFFSGDMIFCAMLDFDAEEMIEADLVVCIVIASK